MSTREPTPFATLLLRYRAAAHLTQEQLGARADLSSDTIAALERGKRRIPRAATVERLADALGLEAPERADLAAAVQASAGAQRGRHASAGPDGVMDGGALHDTHRRPWWLTMEPTPLVGRARELDTIVRTLVAEDTRLLTLTGPAGVGKTRLALAAAARLVEDGDRFPDGVALVDLTPVRDPDLVLGTIARALGLLDVGGRPALEYLAEALAGRRQLVVLDNVEQVLTAASQLADLLSACPGVALLVTSRVPLQLRWERTLRVAPLPVPDLSAALPLPDALLAVSSVALFVGRARARKADFVLGEREAPLVAQLVVQLDGLPLALELAAARLDVLSLSTLARRLGGRLQLLASEAPDLPKRQQSLEAAIGWSYDLLSEPERLVFRCLGVFVGRVTFDAIEAVVGAVAAPEEPPAVGAARATVKRLVSLAEKSLLLPARSDEEDASADKENEELAFGMLETVREYARERLDAAGELAAASRAHAHYFLALAERADAQLRGRDQRAWFFRLDREQDNLRAALRWLLDQAGRDGSDVAAEREAGQRLAAALGYFWYVRGYHTEGMRWLEAALARAPQETQREDEAETGEGVDSAARTRALIADGPLLMVQAQYTRAGAVLKEALALAERRQDPIALVEANMYLGNVTVLAGNVEEGTRQLREAVRRWEVLGNPHGLGETLFCLGYAADMVGETAAAAAHYMAALGQLGRAGNARHAGFVHSYLGVLEWKRGQMSSAVAHLQAALRTSVTLRDRWLLSFATQATVVFVGSHAQPAVWARLLGAADALGQVTGGTGFAWEHVPGAPNMVEPRERLAREGEWNAAYYKGRALPFAKVAALALTLLEEVAQAMPLPDMEAAPNSAQLPERWPQHPNQSPLSARERDVLGLVAQGHSNKAIGRQFFISERTVAQHLTTIFNKLDVNTRAQAVAVATQRGLL
jgi:predicted ATPase/DNA-binding CsgD family transcriptional regulator/transcriptional regulator with XRE-family HTH domain